MEHFIIIGAVLAITAVATAASNSGWLPYRESVIRWAIGEDAVVANADLNRDGTLIHLKHGQSAFVFGSVLRHVGCILHVASSHRALKLGLRDNHIVF